MCLKLSQHSESHRECQLRGCLGEHYFPQLQQLAADECSPSTPPVCHPYGVDNQLYTYKPYVPVPFLNPPPVS
jgi:hypothetical protein